MSATTYPQRHEALRKQILARGCWRHSEFDGTETWIIGGKGEGTALRLPVHPFGDYDERCEQVEITLGLRLPRLLPEVQRAVDAERARCAALLRAAITVESDEEERCDSLCLRYDAGRHEYAASKLQEALTKIEGGDVPTVTCETLGLTAEGLGRLVREVWVQWAREQPNPKPTWLVPWEGLSETDKDVDRRIGIAIAQRAIDALVRPDKGEPR